MKRPHRKKKRKINVASSCLQSVNSSVTFLMTAIVDVKGGRAAKTRVLLDPGAQASFISEALVDAAAARAVSTAHITVQGFGAPAHRMRTTVHQLFLRGLDGSTHEVKAFKRTSLSLEISPVPNEVVERWHHYGVEVSDRQENAQGCDAKVQMLLRADCVNQFLRHKMSSCMV